MELVGTGELFKLFQRRDRIKLPVAVYVMIGVTVSSAFGFRHLYSTAHDRLAYSSGVNGNSAELFMYGPVFNGSTLGGLTAWRSGAIGGVILGLINILLVIRHTRAEEESGRAELVGSAVVGRFAVLTSALLLAVVTNLVSAGVIIAGLCVLGLPAGGATALALGLAGVGLVFAGVAAVTAQLSESARTARGMAVVVLAAVYLLRGVGDAQDSTGHSWLNWVSPVGWTQRLRAFSGDHWPVLALYVLTTAVLITLAFALAARRDLGAGIFADRLGPAAGAAGLRSGFALAWRLQRGTLLGWTVGLAAIGAVIGAAADGISSQLDSSSQLRKVFTNLGGHGQLIDAFLGAAMNILALVAAAYAVQAALTLRTEETAQRAEPVLATTVTRYRWAFGHLFFAIVGPTVALAAAGVTTGLAYGASSGHLGHQLPRLIGAALVQLPAVWMLAGVTIALFGLLPRMSQGAWGVLVIFLLLGQLGEAFQLNQHLLDLSPFSHIPRLPSASLTVQPLLWLVALTVLLSAAGLVGFRRRPVG